MSKNEFLAIFTMLCETYNREPTKGLSMAYYMVLQNITAGQFRDATINILATRKFSTLPLPADILDAINGSADDNALLALHELEAAMQSVGAYNSVCFSDKVTMETVKRMGGWVKICRTHEDEWKFQKKEFCNIYKALSKTSFEPTNYLTGIHQAENEKNAFCDEVEKSEIYLIGFKNVANRYITARQFPELATSLNLHLEAPKNKVMQLVGNLATKI